MTEKESFLEENGFYISAPKGNSMRPFIRGDRDLVVVEQLGAAPQRYDAVLYRRAGGECVIHRIIGRKNGVFLIRGDNCYYTERVKEEQILGVAKRVLRNRTQEVNTEKGSLYAFFVCLWCWAYPLRYAVNFVYRGFRKVFRMIFGKTG